MLRITETILRNWADVIGIDDTKLAEHDYRITHMSKYTTENAQQASISYNRETKIYIFRYHQK